MTISDPESLKTAIAELTNKFGEDYQEYAHDLLLLRHLALLGFRPDVIYDIGGSDGIWSAMADLAFPSKPRFDLFEPLAEDPGYAASRIALASKTALFDSNRAASHPIALGNHNGSCEMVIYKSAVGSTTLVLDHDPEGTEQRKVPCRRLDDYCEKNQLPPPDLMKLDVQGGELEVIRGASKALEHTSVLICECWLIPGYGSRTPLWLEIANALAAHDLHLYDFGWIYRMPNDQRAATLDLLFLKRTLPYSPLRFYDAADLG